MGVDYEKFITQLRQEEGLILKRKLQKYYDINSFLIQFKAEKSNIQVKRQAILRFLTDIYRDSDLHITFIDPETQEHDSENMKEGWEKLVMTKCFDFVFQGVENEEQRSNEVLQKKIQTYSWIEERHLDLNLNFSLGLEIVQAELLRINGFRSPRDKLVILQNVNQLIVDLIQKKSGGESNNDALLPTLILVIIRANPPNLISNVKYITRFRNPSEMEKGSNQFCMTNMMGAISFIYNMSAKSLTLNENELSKWPLQQLRDHTGPSTKDELKEFTDQVQGFFGSLVKEVKSTAGEIFQQVNQTNPGPKSPALFSPDGSNYDILSDQTMSKYDSVASFNAKNLPPGVPKRTQQEQEQITQQTLEREKYEMDLAIAMSLSEAQNNDDNLIDIDQYSPLKTAPALDDESEEEELEKIAKKQEDDQESDCHEVVRATDDDDNLIDIDQYSPLKTAPALDDESEEEQLEKIAKKQEDDQEVENITKYLKGL